jgi:hypothetical protein
MNYRHSLWPNIEYVYQVGDQDFTGDRLFSDTVHHVPTSAHVRQLEYRIANAFKENETIDVYYNPNHYEEAVLDTTIPRKLHVILLVVAMLIVAHVILSVLRIML